MQIDNMEGMALHRDGRETVITMISDDNFNAFQRTLLLEFALAELIVRRAAPPAWRMNAEERAIGRDRKRRERELHEVVGDGEARPWQRDAASAMPTAPRISEIVMPSPGTVPQEKASEKKITVSSAEEITEETKGGSHQARLRSLVKMRDVEELGHQEGGARGDGDARRREMRPRAATASTKPA